MSNADGTIHLVFNGEIYNYLEIRKELEANGRQFRSESDTEVMLALYEEKGKEFVKGLRGMFAFAIFDDNSQKLILGRDRIGIKPLYYCQHGGRLYFASEIKAILSDVTIPRKLNEDALYHYLSFWTTPAPSTMFKDIYKLPPATLLEFSSDGTSSEWKYWELLDEMTNIDGEAEILVQLIENLRGSVNYRKISDVPVGVFLSGGLDSSLNAVLFSENEKEPVKTFSIGYDGDYPNEFEFAQIISNKIGSNHHEKTLCEEQLLDFLPLLTYHQDEPIGDPVCFPIYHVSKLAKDNGVTVCQVGEGSDELFWGYESWKKAYLVAELDRFPVPKIFKRFISKILSIVGMGNSPHNELLERSLADQPLFWGASDRFTENEKKELLSDSFMSQTTVNSSYEVVAPIWEMYNLSKSKKDPLNWMSYMDLSLRLPELLLMRVDRMSMATSVEARVPFLDHEFVKYSMSIAPELKRKNKTLKYILKQASRDIIPSVIIDRKKQGFNVPVGIWLLENLGTTAREVIDKLCETTEIFNKSKIDLLFNRKDPRIWQILTFSLWYLYWIDGRKDLFKP